LQDNILNNVDLDSYTEEQQHIIISPFDDILVVEAKAGSGKTHTIVGFAAARPNSKILYLAYGRANKIDAEKKFKHLKNVVVKTTHGVSFSQFGAKYSKRFEEHGMEIPVLTYAEYCMDVEESNRYRYAYIMSKLLKQFAYSSYTMDEFLELLRLNKREFEDTHKIKINYFLSKITFVWDDLKENEDMPYEHDFYLKEFQLENPYLDYYNYILLDEAQDANNCVIDILLQQKRAKKAFIGDSFQQIYAWRGAENALEKMRDNPNVLKLQLTKSFRCSAEIAKIALEYLKICDKEQKFIGNENIHDDQEKYKDYAIIARSNIQLFQYAAFETGNSKLYFVGGFNQYNFYDLVDLVRLRYKKEHEEVYIRNNFFANFSTLDELIAYAESSNEIDILTKIKVSMSIPKISEELRKLKSRVVAKKEDADIILTTAHKSKGLEWDHVLLLKGFIDLSSYKTEFNLEEIYLLYVAITRAKKRLESETVLVKNERIKINVKDKGAFEVYCPIDDNIKEMLLSK
jgi:hypothetical protein